MTYSKLRRVRSRKDRLPTIFAGANTGTHTSRSDVDEPPQPMNSGFMWRSKMFSVTFFATMASFDFNNPV